MMSVMKPGVIRNAPPKITSTPSMTSRCGTLPSRSVALKRRQTARPCDRSSTPRAANRPPGAGTSTADRVADLRITYSSASGTT